MAVFSFVLLVALVANLLIGGIALRANPTRAQNRLFFVFTIALSAWAACILVAVMTASPIKAEFVIRLGSYISTTFPVIFHGLCLAVVHDPLRRNDLVRRVGPHLLLSQLVGLLAFTNLYISGLEMTGVQPGDASLPLTINGPAYGIVNGYVVGALLGLAIQYGRATRRVGGIAKIELQFILLGSSLGALFVLVSTLLLPQVVPEIVTQRFSPLGLIPMNLTIAYGIATRRLMNVSVLLQRFVAHAILALYLSALYFVILAIASAMLRQPIVSTGFFPHLLAALAVAFSMAPVQGVFQRISKKLFINVPMVDLRRAARIGSEVLASISTADALIGRFTDVIRQIGIDAEYVRVFLPSEEGGDYVLQANHQDGGEESRPTLPSSSMLAWSLRRTTSPVGADLLKRARPTAETMGTAADLDQHGARVAAGIFFKNQIRGVVMLGPRQSGLIYSMHEQDALQILCNQLGVALENARLYTAVRDNKIFNDTLVENLISGLVAVDATGHISVFNREAQRITGLDPEHALGKEIDALPGVLADALRRALDTGDGFRNFEAVLNGSHEAGADDEGTPVNLGTSLLHNARGEVIGALLLVTDLTTLKKLEQQVRRSDRLASIGTLSAGMAHEIKNPLVTIKTFTDLLPERYQDEDFRETFSVLVSQEVNRIDTIVNEVLHFARPAKPNLEPQPLREVVANSLRLLQEQMKQKNIRLVTRFEVEPDLIRADSGLLNQAFVNFFLNALDSMGENGTLTVSTAISEPGWHLTRDRDQDGTPHVRLAIQDTGEGIPQEMLHRIFDPFFTTKSQGTGLGLSVAHGIIQDHLGLIECTSQPGHGTTFNIFFPLVQSEVTT